MSPSKPSRPAQKRGVKRTTKPYPHTRPLGDSTCNNCAQSSSSLPSSSSEEVPLAKKCNKGERPVRRRELGMPTREEYATVEAEYLASLDYRKKAKALISRKMFDNIWSVLHRPNDVEIETPQFRWWVRKMFKLEARTGTDLQHEGDYKAESGSPLVVVHDGKRVAVKEEIYAILCFCHERSGHGGRDRTATEIRKRYTWVPKELIAGFVRSCPTCICKKTGKYDQDRAVKCEEDTSEVNARLAEEYDAQGTGSGSTSDAGSLQLVPLHDLPVGPALGFGHATALKHNYDGPGVWLHPTPAMVPWYMPPSGRFSFGYGTGLSPNFASGPFPGIPSSIPLRCQPPGGTEGYEDEHVRLPSIHTCGRARQAPEDSPKITLPSLAQLLASDQMAPRQPLGTIAGNAPSQHWDSNGTQPQPSFYVPQIDPALLPDGMHMLALAAEASQARRSPCDTVTTA
ncbi:hypothetical protein TRAPUB_360 [Trametes pubescens]|uniref:Integrase zinc-binding domain-containing protein n=1 Tax=Trametes pubescens TaxID=154538 RepID=A0A1M2VMH6_TRAPU|nr:hypothetical protein TRAPUB_360 [Trametes pubescens]